METLEKGNRVSGKYAGYNISITRCRTSDKAGVFIANPIVSSIAAC